MNKTGKGWFQNKLNDQDILTIIKEHKSGKSANSLAKKWDCCSNSIRGYLMKAGVYSPEKQSIPNRYHLNRSFFHAINTEKKAYWLGFLAADGCVQVTKKGSMLCLSLKWGDRDHVSLFLSHMEASHTVKKTSSLCNGKRFFKATTSIWCKEMANDLISHGIVPRKTFKLVFPHNIDKRLIRHYIRGYFDGDGCWMLEKNKYPRFAVAGNKPFIKDLRLILCSECDINMGIRTPSKRHKEETKQIECTGTKQCKRFYDYIYYNCFVYLGRKRKRVSPILEPLNQL
jgi:hypothetical protein